jgi:hypothetical protein
MEIDMATPIELSDELYENVTIFQKLANQKDIENNGRFEFEDKWLERLFEVVEPSERRIASLKKGPPFKTASVEKKFISSFTEAFKLLAIADLECHGLRHATAEKFVNSLIK